MAQTKRDIFSSKLEHTICKDLMQNLQQNIHTNTNTVSILLKNDLHFNPHLRFRFEISTTCRQQILQPHHCKGNRWQEQKMGETFQTENYQNNKYSTPLLMIDKECTQEETIKD
jgi:hypothetical protein